MILVNGDSWTGGWPPNKMPDFGLFWSDYLQQKIDEPIDNLAALGSSNYRIFRTTLEYLQKHTPTHIILGWSGIERFELPIRSHKYLRITHTGVYCDRNYPSDSFKQLIFDLFYKHLYSPNIALDNKLLYILTIQDICKLKNIKLINFNSYCNQIKENNELYNKIDITTWIPSPLTNMRDTLSQYPRVTSGHANADGMKHWSELLYKMIKK